MINIHELTMKSLLEIFTQMQKDNIETINCNECYGPINIFDNEYALCFM